MQRECLRICHFQVGFVVLALLNLFIYLLILKCEVLQYNSFSWSQIDGISLYRLWSWRWWIAFGIEQKFCSSLFGFLLVGNDFGLWKVIFPSSFLITTTNLGTDLWDPSYILQWYFLPSSSSSLFPLAYFLFCLI